MLLVQYGEDKLNTRFLIFTLAWTARGVVSGSSWQLDGLEWSDPLCLEALAFINNPE